MSKVKVKRRVRNDGLVGSIFWMVIIVFTSHQFLNRSRAQVIKYWNSYFTQKYTPLLYSKIKIVTIYFVQWEGEFYKLCSIPRHSIEINLC